MRDLYRKTFSRFEAKEVNAQDIIEKSKSSSSDKARYLKRAACIVVALMILIPTSSFASNYVVQNNSYYKAFYGNFNKDFISKPVYDWDGEPLVSTNTSTPTPVSEEDTKRILGESVKELDNVCDIDGIKVTVEALTYDNETKAGQVYFSLEKEGIKNDVDILDCGELYGTNKYYFSLSDASQRLVVDTANSTENKLYIKGYYIFSYDEWIDSEPKMDIYFYKNAMPYDEFAKSTELGIVSVPIQDGACNVKKASNENTTVAVSPISIKIRSNKILQEEANEGGTIILKDGTEFVSDDNAVVGYMEEDGECGIVSIAFNTLLDVDQVDKIMIFGETIEFK